MSATDVLYALPPQILAIGALALAVLVFGIWAMIDQRRKDRERAQVFQEFAAAKGFRFEPKEPETRKQLGLPFGWGSHSQRNFIRGVKDGVPFVLFDFLIAQKNRRLLRTWIAFEASPDYPRFQVIPNTLIYVLNRQLTWDKAEFPMDPSFAEAYRVEAPDTTRVAPLFNDTARGALTQRRGWTVESRNGWLQMTDHELDKPPESLDSFLSASLDIARPLLGR